MMEGGATTPSRCGGRQEGPPYADVDAEVGGSSLSSPSSSSTPSSALISRCCRCCGGGGTEEVDDGGALTTRSVWGGGGGGFGVVLRLNQFVNVIQYIVNEPTN